MKNELLQQAVKHFPSSSDPDVAYDYTPAGHRLFAGSDTYSHVDVQTQTTRGLLVQEAKGVGGTLKYEYDGSGNRTKLTVLETLGATTVTEYVFDELDRPITVIENPQTPEALQTHYAYDEVGNRSLVRYPNKTCMTYAYDSLNRLTRLTNQREDAAGACMGEVLSEFIYTLGPAGNRIQVDEMVKEATGTSRVRTVKYEYDKLYRLTKETAIDDTPPGPQQRVVREYTYDRVGNRLTERITDNIDLPSITDVIYDYDDNDRLLSKAQSSMLAENISLSDLPRYADGARPPSRWASRALIGFGILTLSCFFAPLALARASRRAGRLSRHERFVRAVAAVLIPVMGFGPESVWALHQEAMAYSSVSQALAAAVTAGLDAEETWIYEYDNNGNLIYRSDGSTSEVLDYDRENRLRSSTLDPDNDPDTPLPLNAVPTVRYGYDADGIRNGKLVADGPFIAYLTDKNRDYAQVVVETTDPDVPGAQVTRYTYGDDLIAQTRSGARSYYHYDGQLSVRQLTDAPTDPVVTPPVITDTYTFDAFGNTTAQTPNDGTSTINNYLYTGEQYDPNVGFYYLRARYYDHGVGRFASTDVHRGNPYSPASLHKYAYVGADPVNNIDPSGLTEGNLNSQLAQITIRAQIFTASVGSRAAAAFAAGSTAIGRFWNQLGAFAQAIARQVLN